MNVTSLVEQLFDALQEFDRTVQPFGLYSVRDIPSQVKPQDVVRPFKQQIELRGDLQEIHEFCDDLADVRRWGGSDDPHFHLAVPDFGSVSLQMVRIAKIKVRQYGSRYHLDKHLNYEHRWENLELDKEILKLRQRRAENMWQMLLFLGFDKAQRPFERELGELKSHQERVNSGLEYFERSWDDANGRGFKIKLALWGHQVSASLEESA